MFLRKRRLTYQDFLKNTQTTTTPIKKPETTPKMQALLNKTKPHIDKMINLRLTSI